MIYYQGTITALRKAIERKANGTQSVSQRYFRKGGIAPPSHLLLMCELMEGLDTSSVDDSLKAARSIGWISAHAELSGIWTHNTSQRYICKDRKEGFDKPSPPLP